MVYLWRVFHRLVTRQTEVVTAFMQLWIENMRLACKLNVTGDVIASYISVFLRFPLRDYLQCANLIRLRSWQEDFDYFPCNIN